ncbi:hypothetical protein GCM10010972_28130 [Cellulomonas carbonis]|uniref:Uncharacterized protein n=1 Tax=Cellulomonas carbonis T26 TaxID=947969 RepID=A0A0A0BNT2_9CELL|nr:hypothetical protein N868_06780 [Cellulomonas carbonis T26]GGC13176.1 hypothetical protein GCM10010972_28130 [Cellulomonas carbonis]
MRPLRLAARELTVGRQGTGTSGTTTWTYDQVGNLTSVTNTFEYATSSYGYDRVGRIVSTTDSGGTTTYGYRHRRRAGHDAVPAPEWRDGLQGSARNAGLAASSTMSTKAAAVFASRASLARPGDELFTQGAKQVFFVDGAIPSHDCGQVSRERQHLRGRRSSAVGAAHRRPCHHSTHVLQSEFRIVAVPRQFLRASKHGTCRG